MRLVRVGPVGKALPRGARHSRFAPKVQAAYRQKLRALQLVEYERVMFLDADVLVTKNMDALFEDPRDAGAAFVAARGAIAPLNAGVWLATPSCAAFADVNDVASGGAFDRATGPS